MKRILVVYYSQSGQLKQIIDSLLSPMEEVDELQIDFECLQPEPEYPFPWGNQFFDCFPETVKGIPCKLRPYKFNPETRYDLILLAYQPWYLSPSIPCTSFLKSKEAQKVLKGKNVITVIGSRNMWTRSQEIVKSHLVQIGAKLVGNIVLVDRTNNYLAGITIIRWLTRGIKGPSFLLPEAGISQRDIQNASRHGRSILESITQNKYDQLQQKLVLEGAVEVKYHLTCIEKNARKIFDIFANYILKKGGASEPTRKGRIQQFKAYLLFVFFVLSPFFSFIFIVKRWVLYPLVEKEINYYKATKLIVK